MMQADEWSWWDWIFVPITIILLLGMICQPVHAQAPADWIATARAAWLQVSPTEQSCINRNLSPHAIHRNVGEYIKFGITPTHADIINARKLCAGEPPQVKVATPEIRYSIISEEEKAEENAKKVRWNIFWTVVGLIIGVYLTPTLIAVMRGHPSWGGIFVMNLFLGWTGIFWIWALIWAASATKKRIVVEYPMAIEEAIRRK